MSLSFGIATKRQIVGTTVHGWSHERLYLGAWKLQEIAKMGVCVLGSNHLSSDRKRFALWFEPKGHHTSSSVLGYNNQEL